MNGSVFDPYPRDLSTCNVDLATYYAQAKKIQGSFDAFSVRVVNSVASEMNL